jgi:hypothetical protein
MADIFYYDPETKDVTYFNDVGVNFIQSIIKEDIYFFSLTLEYGDEKVKQIADIGNRDSSLGHECLAKLLHPVLRVSKKVANVSIPVLVDEVHFDEDLLARFVIKEQFYDKFLRTLRMFIPYAA